MDFKEFIINFLKLLVLLFGIAVFVIFVKVISDKLDDKRNKEKCYEIYATDNVILKKCEKYFDKEVNDNE